MRLQAIIKENNKNYRRIAGKNNEMERILQAHPNLEIYLNGENIIFTTDYSVATGYSITPVKFKENNRGKIPVGGGFIDIYFKPIAKILHLVKFLYGLLEKRI